MFQSIKCASSDKLAILFRGFLTKFENKHGEFTSLGELIISLKQAGSLLILMAMLDKHGKPYLVFTTKNGTDPRFVKFAHHLLWSYFLAKFGESAGEHYKNFAKTVAEDQLTLSFEMTSSLVEEHGAHGFHHAVSELHLLSISQSIKEVGPDQLNVHSMQLFANKWGIPVTDLFVVDVDKELATALSTLRVNRNGDVSEVWAMLCIKAKHAWINSAKPPPHCEGFVCWREVPTGSTFPSYTKGTDETAAVHKHLNAAATAFKLGHELPPEVREYVKFASEPRKLTESEKREVIATVAMTPKMSKLCELILAKYFKDIHLLEVNFGECVSWIVSCKRDDVFAKINSQLGDNDQQLLRGVSLVQCAEPRTLYATVDRVNIFKYKLLAYLIATFARNCLKGSIPEALDDISKVVKSLSLPPAVHAATVAELSTWIHYAFPLDRPRGWNFIPVFEDFAKKFAAGEFGAADARKPLYVVTALPFNQLPGWMIKALEQSNRTFVDPRSLKNSLPGMFTVVNTFRDLPKSGDFAVIVLPIKTKPTNMTDSEWKKAGFIAAKIVKDSGVDANVVCDEFALQDALAALDATPVKQAEPAPVVAPSRKPLVVCIGVPGEQYKKLENLGFPVVVVATIAEAKEKHPGALLIGLPLQHPGVGPKEFAAAKILQLKTDAQFLNWFAVLLKHVTGISCVCLPYTPPGSGKTTFFAKLQERIANSAIVSSDDLDGNKGAIGNAIIKSILDGAKVILFDGNLPNAAAITNLKKYFDKCPIELIRIQPRFDADIAEVALQAVIDRPKGTHRAAGPDVAPDIKKYHIDPALENIGNKFCHQLVSLRDPKAVDEAVAIISGVCNGSIALKTEQAPDDDASRNSQVLKTGTPYVGYKVVLVENHALAAKLSELDITLPEFGHVTVVFIGNGSDAKKVSDATEFLVKATETQFTVTSIAKSKSLACLNVHYTNISGESVKAHITLYAKDCAPVNSAQLNGNEKITYVNFKKQSVTESVDYVVPEEPIVLTGTPFQGEPTQHRKK